MAKKKASGAKASGGRGGGRGARARAGARRSSAAGGRTAQRAPARRPAAAAVEEPTAGYATLAEVAARANSDPEFFLAVARSASDVNQSLGAYGLKLSKRDAATLRDGLETVIDIGTRFHGRGGWGVWPVFPF